MNCPDQELCQDYYYDGKYRTHHTRLTSPCRRFEDGTCPMFGRSCNMEKVRRIKSEYRQKETQEKT